MDSVDVERVERVELGKHLATVREHLRALGTLLEADGAVRVAFASALGALDDATKRVEADPRQEGRVACPFCGFRVMRAATLCMSCWHRQPSRES